MHFLIEFGKADNQPSNPPIMRETSLNPFSEKYAAAP